MICENELCIYQKDKQCCLKTVSINALGMCNETILANICTADLEQYKEQTRRSLNETDPNL